MNSSQCTPEDLKRPLDELLAAILGGDAAALVEEKDVEIAAGAELPPAVAADGHQGDAVGGGEQLREPCVDERGVRATEGTAPRRRVAEQCLQRGVRARPDQLLRFGSA